MPLIWFGCSALSLDIQVLQQWKLVRENTYITWDFGGWGESILFHSFTTPLDHAYDFGSIWYWATLWSTDSASLISWFTALCGIGPVACCKKSLYYPVLLNWEITESPIRLHLIWNSCCNGVITLSTQWGISSRPLECLYYQYISNF